jgi:hypothetical protein
VKRLLWQKWLNHRHRPYRRRPIASRRCRPRLDALENRLAPAVLTVNTPTDGNDPAVLSLRQAILAVDNQSLANLTPQQRQQVSGVLGGNDQIRFAPGLSGPIRLAQGELDITQPVVIAGPGAGNLSIDARGQSRVFAVPTWTNPGTKVTLDGLTITGGSVPNGEAGGIYNVGTLTINNCVLSSNSAGSLGGGIDNDFGGTLTLTNSVLSNNSAGTFGGGIFNEGSMTVSNSILFHNSAGSRGGGIDNYNGGGWVIDSSLLVNSSEGIGGGIDNGGALTVLSSTLSGNSAGGGGGINNSGAMFVGESNLNANSASGLGGGILNAGKFGMTVRGCTLAGNSAGLGGGIFNAAMLTVNDSTFIHNSAGLDGGGIFNAGTLTVNDSTFISNSAGHDGGGIKDSSRSLNQSGNTFTGNSPNDVS